MQIWRMHTDGSQPEQLTFDDYSNWFAHPSPDNKWIVYIAYTTNERQSHLFGKQVKLRLMNLSDKSTKDLTPVFLAARALSMYRHGAPIVKNCFCKLFGSINLPINKITCSICQNKTNHRAEGFTTDWRHKYAGRGGAFNQYGC